MGYLEGYIKSSALGLMFSKNQIWIGQSLLSILPEPRAHLILHMQNMLNEDSRMVKDPGSIMPLATWFGMKALPPGSLKLIISRWE